MRIDLLGDPAGPLAHFEPALRRQCSELAIDLDLGEAGAGASAPAVAVVFPGRGAVWTEGQAGESTEGLYARFAEARYPVLPIVVDASEARWLPAALSGFNAFQTGLWRHAWAEGLVDEVLSLGWQRRRERRVFISYKRSDSGPVARQLYDALTARGYLTFLDDVSIPKGEEFQRELKWWLNDADVVMVLSTPGFQSSRWCVEEISAAKSGSIGLLGVVWPAEVFGDPPPRAFPQPPAPPPGNPVLQPVHAAIDADQRLELKQADFTGGPADPLWAQPLTDDGLATVLAHCARQRATAIRMRLENLIPLAEYVLKPSSGLQPAGVPGDYAFVDAQGGSAFVRLLPFRPDPRALHDAFKSAGAQATVGCLYSECDVQDPRADAMRWLATGRQSPANAAQRTTRIWACVGDRELG